MVIYKMTGSLKITESCITLPVEFKKFHGHLRTLTYFLKPDYPYYIKLFEQAIERLGIQQTDPFDWEQLVTGFIRNTVP